MAEFPAIPLWTDALLGDTQHLSQAEFGAYMLMMIVAWRSPGCCLPNDDKFLARISRSDRNWQRIKRAVMSFWTIGADGRLRQKRLSYEYLAAAELKAQRSEAGKSSARKRKERLLTTVDAMLQRGSNGNPTPNPSTISNEERIEADASMPIARSKPCDDGHLEEAAVIWNQMAAANGLSQVDKLDAKRKSKLRARLRDCGGLEGWRSACGKIPGNDFLTGANPDGWRANFDFMLKPDKFTKLMEGAYDRNRKPAASGSVGGSGFAALFAKESRHRPD